MAKVVIKIKALPKDISENVESLSKKLKEFLAGYGAVYKMEVEPLAFGLNVIMITLVADESAGTAKLEADFTKFKDAEMSIVDMSRMPEV